MHADIQSLNYHLLKGQPVLFLLDVVTPLQTSFLHIHEGWPDHFIASHSSICSTFGHDHAVLMTVSIWQVQSQEGGNHVALFLRRWFSLIGPWDAKGYQHGALFLYKTSLGF